MTLSPRAVEAAARAYADEACEILYPHHIDRIRAALTAALAVDGLCLVPKEPTRSMYEAAYAINGGKWTDSEYEPPPKDCWAAMLAAASTGDSTRQREGK